MYPTLLTFKGISVNSFGFFLILGLIFGLFLYWRKALAEGFPESKVWDFALASLFGGVVGGRVYFLLWHWDRLEGTLLNLFRVWNGELTYIGAILGASIFGLFYVYRQKWALFKILDILIPACAAARVFAFTGAYLGGLGKPTALYQAISGGIVFLILLLRSRKKLLIGFLGAFGLYWLFVEDLVASLFRYQRHVFHGINFDQLFILAFLLLVLVGWISRLRKYGFAKIKKSMALKINFPKSFLKSVRERLVHEDQRITREESKLKKNDPYLEQDRTRSNEYIEDAQEDIGKTVFDRSRYALGRMKIQVKRALAKVHLGTYGVCEKCKKPIDKKRLEAFPASTLCKDCSEKEDNARRNRNLASK